MDKPINIGGNGADDAKELKDDAVDNLENSSSESTVVDVDNSSTGAVADEAPQEFTESYGTGVREIPGYVIKGNQFYDDDRTYNEASPTLTGGDIDANYEQANAEGDESVGGTVSTPDMDIVDNLGKAVGLEMDDANFLHTNDILEQRDDRRWELEPRSSEDYEERRTDLESD